MINVPNYVEDEQAYIAGAMRNIAANARKGATKRMRERLEQDPAFAELIRFIHARAEKGNKFFVAMAEAIENYGALTEKQEAACRTIFEKEAERKAEIRAKDAGSLHIGTLTLSGYAVFESMYGDQHLHFLQDADGNVIVYKGSKKLPVEKGASITVKATVKKHDERDGIKQTLIARPV